ncbi:MAG: hypothetical protein ACM31G_08780 [Flavobacteriales bacterium]
MKLLISQKDALYKLIEDSGYFSPLQFEISEIGSTGNRFAIVEFKNSQFRFEFSDSVYANSYILNYTPGKHQYSENTSHLHWLKCLEQFQMWLENIYRESTTPNYWTKFKDEVSYAVLGASFDNSKFSINEFEELNAKMDILKNQLNTLPLLIEQQNAISEQLDRLNELAKDLGKFDWKNLFIGTMISVIIQLGVTREGANALWELIKAVFSKYFLS